MKMTQTKKEYVVHNNYNRFRASVSGEMDLLFVSCAAFYDVMPLYAVVSCLNFWTRFPRPPSPNSAMF